MPNEMDYSLLRRTPDGTGMILVTNPGTPETGAFETEQDLKNWITAGIGGGIVPKGDILSSNLPAADDSNKGWEYYCTDLNKYAISDGTAWIYFSNSPIVQTPDATDTGHALSNAVVTQCCNEVKGKLNQHDSRLQNLEQKAGDYSIVQYRGTNAVPTGKAKYGLVKNIVGKSRAWNQLCKSVATTTDNGVTFTNNGDGSYTLNGTAGTGGAYILLFPDSDRISSHSYMAWDDNNSNSEYGFGLNRVRRTIYPAGYGFNAILFVGEGVTVSNIVVYPILRDITAIFGLGNEPLTAADAIKAIPDIVKNEDFTGYSLVDTVVSGARSVGVNIWDEELRNGYYNSSGIFVSDNTYISNVNAIRVLPNTEYYFKISGFEVFYYDINGNFISKQGTYSNYAVTTPSNCFYLNLHYPKSVEELNRQSQICLNSYADKTTYHPYKTDTLSLPEPVTLRSAGSVAEVLTLETGKKTRPIGNVDLGTLNWIYDSTYNLWRAEYSSGVPLNGQTHNCLYSVGISTNFLAILADPSIIGYFMNDTAYSGIERIYVKNGSNSVSPTGNFYYELATPLSDEQVCDPVPDNTLYTEGGGTIDTIQDQTPVIDNCLDVGYLAV